MNSFFNNLNGEIVSLVLKLFQKRGNNSQLTLCSNETFLYTFYYSFVYIYVGYVLEVELLI